MNNKTISLNGEWQMAWCDIGAGNPAHFAAMDKLLYQVPGDVHTPLIQAGLMGEPLYGVHDLACRWVEDKEFWCERTFVLEPDRMRAVMQLTFEGLDCTADVYLNGVYVGRHNNAFVEITWDVTQWLHPGENKLLVRIDQGLVEAQQHDLEQMGLMWNNEQPWRVWMRKPQFVYGWDWTIWLASCGIWRDVYLTCFDQTIITDVYARVEQEVLAEGQPCAVAVTVEQQTTRLCSVVCCIANAMGNNVACCEESMPGDTHTLHLTIQQAHLWWCNGMGEPYLYTVAVVLKAEDGTTLDSRTQRWGLRTIALEEPEVGNGESGFTFLLNGERVFCKGANHVPCDCLPGRITDDKERRLIELAQDAHMNMLRIWGGGVYASEALMNACDETGIMIWHDFMYACGYYPDHDPGFVENITTESRKAIRRLRRHASLIGWAGNNEIQEMYHSQKQWHPELRWYGGTIYEKILPELVREMCPTLIYRQSSPYGGERQADCRRGDQHIWTLTHVESHPHYLDLWRFTEFEAKFLSEFGLMGAMTMETAQACIPPENMNPDDSVWLHHTNSCQNHTLLDRMVKQYFGAGNHSPQQYILRSQAIQAEITRHMYEEFRRRKFVCSGLLFWTLSDSWGVHNWSLIDYGLRRKPIYHALKRAMAPVALCIKGWDVQNDEGRIHWQEHWRHEPGKLEIWGMNDARMACEAQMQWSLQTLTGEMLLAGDQHVYLPENQSVHLTDVPLDALAFDPAKVIFRARLVVDGRMMNETKYFFAPFAEMPAQEACVRCTAKPGDDGHYEVTLTADRFVWMVHLEEPDGTTYADNDFDLWPGEPKTVLAAAKGGHFTPVFHWMGKED